MPMQDMPQVFPPYSSLQTGTTMGELPGKIDSSGLSGDLEKQYYEMLMREKEEKKR